MQVLWPTSKASFSAQNPSRRYYFGGRVFEKANSKQKLNAPAFGYGLEILNSTEKLAMSLHISFAWGVSKLQINTRLDDLPWVSRDFQVKSGKIKC
jgi:hypothetical protein